MWQVKVKSLEEAKKAVKYAKKLGFNWHSTAELKGTLPISLIEKRNIKKFKYFYIWWRKEEFNEESNLIFWSENESPGCELVNIFKTKPLKRVFWY